MTLTPVMDTARLRCYKAPPSSRYLGNGLSDRKLDGGPVFEGRGILVIAVCGLYAIFLFLAARAVSYIFKKVTAPVRSVSWKREVREVKMVTKPLTADDNNNETVKCSRKQTRTISHG